MSVTPNVSVFVGFLEYDGGAFYALGSAHVRDLLTGHGGIRSSGIPASINMRLRNDAYSSILRRNAISVSSWL